MHLPGITTFAVLAAVAIGGCAWAPAPESPAAEPAATAAPGTLRVDFVPVTRAGEPGTPFPVSGGVEAVAARLRGAGLEVTGQDASRGTVSGRSTSNALIDCGVGVITGGPEERRFDANAELAVVPAPGSTGADFNTRELASETEFRVALAAGGAGGTVARVEESHRVELTVRALDGNRVIDTGRLSFAGSQIGAFRDGMTCTSSGEIRRLLQ
jgi:hypothetical protein